MRTLYLRFYHVSIANGATPMSPMAAFTAKSRKLPYFWGIKYVRVASQIIGHAERSMSGNRSLWAIWKWGRGGAT